MRNYITVCVLSLLVGSCTRTARPQPNVEDDQRALDRDVIMWAQPHGAIAEWRTGPFTVQVQDALRGKRLLLKGVSVADVIREENGHHALLVSDDVDVIFERSNVPSSIQFLVACSETDAEAILAKADDLTSNGKDYLAADRGSVLDGIVDVTSVRRVSAVDLEASSDGDSAHIDATPRNRFLAVGKLVALRIRPHPIFGHSEKKN